MYFKQNKQQDPRVFSWNSVKMAIYSGQNMLLCGAEIKINLTVMQTELLIVCAL